MAGTHTPKWTVDATALFWSFYQSRFVAPAPLYRHHCHCRILTSTVSTYVHNYCWLSSQVPVAVQVSWNVMAQAQKPDFVFRRNGRVHLNRQGRQFNRLLATEVCASAVVMLNIPCSEVVWRVLATHSIRQFPLQFLSRASPCAITFQLESTLATRVPGSVGCSVLTHLCTYLVFSHLHQIFTDSTSARRIQAASHNPVDYFNSNERRFVYSPQTDVSAELSGI
jgi:hypothetical protein